MERLKQSRIPQVLIVENDLFTLEAISSAVEDRLALVAAHSAIEALERVVSNPPDLVISELGTNQVNGLELCSSIKANPITSHIPVILLATRCSVQSQVEVLRTGADDYIFKPFHVDVLVARVDNLIENRRVLRERFSRVSQVLREREYTNSPDQEFIARAFSVLDAQSTNPDFSADTFAEKMNVGIRTLHRKLKALTNDTPSKLIWNIRLNKAAALLRQRDRRVTDVAFEVGFSESSHFSRSFRQYFGQSPSEYRAQTTFVSFESRQDTQV